MFIIYLLLFLFLFSLLRVLLLIFRVRSKFKAGGFAKREAERKDGEVTLHTGGASQRKIDPSLGQYVDYNETKQE